MLRLAPMVTGAPLPRGAHLARPIRNLRWYIGGLLFLSTVINYIDRQTLSVLAPYLKTEYQWTNTDFAWVLISFRVAYSVGQTLAGRIIDRLGTRDGLSLSVLWYSVAAMATSLAGGLRSFAGFRFALGLGEAGNWPGATKAVSEWFPRRESGWAVALFDSGSSIGGALAPWIVLTTYHAFSSWRPAFVLTGILGFLWLLLFRWFYRKPEDHPRLSAEERAYILSDRARGRGAARTPSVRASLPRAAAPAPDLGLHHLQDVHRPRLVLHHRLVRDLPRGQGLQARGEPDRLLGPVHRRRPRQLLRRRALQPPHQARLERGRGAQGHRRHRRAWG